MPTKRLVYWDSCVYIDCIQKTPGRWAQIEPVLRQAEQGEIEFVASALVIAEVVKCPAIASDDDKIRDFFENDFIKFRNVDRRTAEEAAKLSRAHGIKPPDAIHVATAIMTKCETLHTYDDKLLVFDGKAGVPRLAIGNPIAVVTSGKQQSLFDQPTAKEGPRKPVTAFHIRSAVDWLMLNRSSVHPLRKVLSMSRPAPRGW